MISAGILMSEGCFTAGNMRKRSFAEYTVLAQRSLVRCGETVFLPLQITQLRPDNDLLHASCTESCEAA